MNRCEKLRWTYCHADCWRGTGRSRLPTPAAGGCFGPWRTWRRRCGRMSVDYPALARRKCAGVCGPFLLLAGVLVRQGGRGLCFRLPRVSSRCCYRWRGTADSRPRGCCGGQRGCRPHWPHGVPAPGRCLPPIGSCLSPCPRSSQRSRPWGWWVWHIAVGDKNLALCPLFRKQGRVILPGCGWLSSPSLVCSQANLDS